MTAQTIYTRPVKTMIIGFLGFALAAATLAAGQKMSVLEPATVKRAMGLVIGIMIVITGNFLPKIRPLYAPGVNPSGAATAAERFGGWTLVLVGIVYVTLFAFAPLDQARRISSILGIGAIAVIAANWAWLVRGALFGGRDTSEQTAPDGDYSVQKRRLILPMLVAFLYTFVTACTTFLLHDRRQIEEAGWWMFLGFWLIYAALMVILDSKRCSK